MRHPRVQPPWHRQSGYTVLFLLLFFPLGLILMWRNGFWSLWTRVLITGIFWVFVIQFVTTPGRRQDSLEPGSPEPRTLGGSAAKPGASTPAVEAVAPLERAHSSAITKREAQAMAGEMALLLRQGREMEPLRDPPQNDPNRLEAIRRCGMLMRERQARVRAIRSRAAGLPDSVLNLGIAAIHLELCVSCSTTLARQNCSDAAEALREGMAELAKASW